MALATAAAVPVMPISPMPRAPSGWNLVSGMLRQVTSMMPMSALTGTWYSAREFVGGAAVDGVDVGSVLVEGEGDAPDDAAHELVEAGLVVHEGADVVGGDDAADLTMWVYLSTATSAKTAPKDWEV